MREQLKAPQGNVSKAAVGTLLQLDLSGAQVKDLAFLSDFVNLRSLILDVGDAGHGTVLDLKPLVPLQHLKELQIRGAAFEDLAPLSQLPALSALTLNNAGLTDLTALSQQAFFANLETLVLDQNQIADITPLARGARIKTLSLSDNPVEDLAALAKQPLPLPISEPQ